ncbi:hypothetical protein Tco_0392960 [Tanacetum coccineum]
MLNSMLSYSGLSQGFWGGAMLTACYLLNRVPNKRNMITPYELWTKRKTNLNYLVVWGCRAVVRLTDPKLKTLGERGLECIFVGYAEHSKDFRFSSVPRPSLRIPNGTEDIGGSVVPKEVTEEVVQQPEPELRKSKRNRTPKAFGPGFQLYLIEGTMDEVSDQHSYCFNVENVITIHPYEHGSGGLVKWKRKVSILLERKRDEMGRGTIIVCMNWINFHAVIATQQMNVYKPLKGLQQGESLNVQDVNDQSVLRNLKFTSEMEKSMES